jgi:hypothetical protein
MVEACIGLAVPGRPIRPRLVADACGAPILCDQTAGNPTGPRWGREPSRIGSQQRTTMDNDAAGKPACPLAA